MTKYNMTARHLALAALILMLQATTLAQAAQSTREYDARGNLVRITDPLGHINEQSWDTLGRITQQRPPHPTSTGTQGQIGYVYDGQQRIKAITDPRSLSTTYTTDGLGNTTQLVSPDTGTSHYQYDAAGNLTQKSDARGVVTAYQYDALNRLTQITYTLAGVTDETVTLAYDQGVHGKGRLTTMMDASGQSTWQYDAQGRVLRRTQQGIGFGGTPGVSFSTVYTYESSGRLATLTYPSGRQLAYTYNAAGQIQELRLDGQILLTNLAYEPFGPVRGWVWGNAQSHTRIYDANGRMTGFSFGDATRKIDWDAASRITQLQDQSSAGGLSAVASASYDNRDWLTGYTTPSSSYAYGYDSNGNRALLGIGGSSYANALASGSNRLMSTAGPSPARSYGYDAAGYPTGDTVRSSYVWTYSGRLKSSTAAGITTGYLYNGLAQRVRKGQTYNGTRYVYDEAGHLIGEYDDFGRTVQEHFWLGDTPVAMQRIDNNEALLDDASFNVFNKVGTWTSASTIAGAQGGSYKTHPASGASADVATWKPWLSVSQPYKVYARWVESSANSANAAYTITHLNPATGSNQNTTVSVDQRSQGGQWVYLGTWEFNTSGTHQVRLAPQTDGQVVADAIKLVPGTATENTYFVQADQIDTPRALLGNAGQIVWRWEGEGFGSTLPNEDPDGNAQTLQYNLRFPGQVYDKESGLHYNWNRYYDPTTGRYLSPDPLGLKAGPNLFAYVDNSPTTAVDPEGLMGSRGPTPEDKTPCEYYKEVCQKEGCAYHCNAYDICMGNPTVDSIGANGLLGACAGPSKKNCVRRCLVREDKKARENPSCKKEIPCKDGKGGKCTKKSCIDNYHNQCFTECSIGISIPGYGNACYGGNIGYNYTNDGN